MSYIAAQPGDVIDFSLAEMPVKIEDRSFDTKMVPELITYLKDFRDHSLDYVVPGSKMEVKPVGGSNWELWIDSPETTDFYQDEVGGQIISKVLPAVKIFKPTNWAMSQTVGKTPMPKRYNGQDRREREESNEGGLLMPKYEVQFSLTGSYTATVEAADVGQAEKKARERFEPDWVEIDGLVLDDIREVA